MGCYGSMLRAAAIQMSSGSDKRANVERAGALIRAAAKQGAQPVEIPGQVSARESQARKPGEEPVVVRTDIGAVGLSVCYDLRFPELYRRLVRAGAEILCIPSAFTFPTGAAHWEPLVRARAIENQCYVIAPDQYGTSPNGYRD